MPARAIQQLEPVGKRHAELSPSGAHRWMRCHGSVALTRGIPSLPSKYSTEGSVAHELADMTLKSRHKRAENYIGARIKMDGGVHTVTRNMAENVQVYVDFVMDQGGLMVTEQVLSIHHLTGETWEDEDGEEQEAGGTTDTLIFATNGYEMKVIDLKYGRMKVKADQNEQLMMYASAALRRYEYLFEIQFIEIVIVMPRLDFVDRYGFDVQELREFEALVRESVEAIHAGDESLNPSPKACQWCEARRQQRCPALKAQAAEKFPIVNLEEE